MKGLDREQLEAMKRQIEEDYRLDIAAIDRLLYRMSSPTTTAPAPSYSAPAPAVEIKEPAWPAVQPQTQPDELAGSIRAMFGNGRK